MILLGHVRGPVNETAFKGAPAYSFELVERVLVDGELHAKVYRIVAVISMLEADLVTPGMLFEAVGRPIGWRDGDRGVLAMALLAHGVIPRDPWDHLLALHQRDNGYDYWAAQPEAFWEEARAKREALLIRRAGGTATAPAGAASGQADEVEPVGGGLVSEVLLGLNSVPLGEHVPELARSIRRSPVKLEEGWAKFHNVSLMASVLGAPTVGEDLMRVYAAQSDPASSFAPDAGQDDADEDDIPLGNEYLLD